MTQLNTPTQHKRSLDNPNHSQRDVDRNSTHPGFSYKEPSLDGIYEKKSNGNFASNVNQSPLQKIPEETPDSKRIRPKNTFSLGDGRTMRQLEKKLEGQVLKSKKQGLARSSISNTDDSFKKNFFQSQQQRNGSELSCEASDGYSANEPNTAVQRPSNKLEDIYESMIGARAFQKPSRPKSRPKPSLTPKRKSKPSPRKKILAPREVSTDPYQDLLKSRQSISQGRTSPTKGKSPRFKPQNFSPFPINTPISDIKAAQNKTQIQDLSLSEYNQLLNTQLDQRINNKHRKPRKKSFQEKIDNPSYPNPNLVQSQVSGRAETVKAYEIWSEYIQEPETKPTFHQKISSSQPPAIPRPLPINTNPAPPSVQNLSPTKSLLKASGYSPNLQPRHQSIYEKGQEMLLKKTQKILKLRTKKELLEEREAKFQPKINHLKNLEYLDEDYTSIPVENR